MEAASFAARFMDPDLAMFSSPAKSTKFILECRINSSWFALFANKLMVNMVCDADETSLSLVAATLRLLKPFASNSKPDFWSPTKTSFKFWMRMVFEFFLASKIFNVCLAGSGSSLSKSLRFSLYNSINEHLTKKSSFSPSNLRKSSFKTRGMIPDFSVMPSSLNSKSLLPYMV